MNDTNSEDERPLFRGPGSKPVPDQRWVAMKVKEIEISTLRGSFNDLQRKMQAVERKYDLLQIKHKYLQMYVDSCLVQDELPDLQVLLELAK